MTETLPALDAGLAIAVEVRDAPPGAVIVEVAGEVDFRTVQVLRDALAAAAGPGVRVVVDLSGVDFCDSSGLGALVGGLKRARCTGGHLVLAGMPEILGRVFAHTGLSKAFDVYGTVEAALAAA